MPDNDFGTPKSNLRGEPSAGGERLAVDYTSGHHIVACSLCSGSLTIRSLKWNALDVTKSLFGSHEITLIN